MTGTAPRLHSIKTKAQLAAELGIPISYLTDRSFRSDQSKLYRQFSIRKRSGGDRVIHAPYWPTALAQYRLLPLLEEIYRPSNRVMAFVKGKGIKENAIFHVGKRLILNIDLKDFFNSIHAGRIRRRLMARPYSLTDDVATTIAKICTLNGKLPTGSPTSPIISNILCSNLDGELAKYSKRHGCFYTRYADDLTFSTNRKTFPEGMIRRSSEQISGIEAGAELEDIIKKQGFEIQPKKTRLMDKTTSQEVCGVTCNERINVRRAFYRELRGAINACKKYGIEQAEIVWKQKYNWRESKSLERSLKGKINHLIHIRGPNDPVVYNMVNSFNSIPDRSDEAIEYKYESQIPLGIDLSICLIECSDTRNKDNLNYSQGSGFIIAGGSVITNSHVVNYINKFNNLQTNFPEIIVTLEGNELKFEMEIIYNDAKRDIAVLRVKDSSWNSLFSARACSLSFTNPRPGAEIRLIGYPSHAPGGSYKQTPGVITGTTPFDGQPFFTISAIIVSGNSGGPVIDKFGQVIGIATRGVSPDEKSDLAFNGCIPLHTIDKAVFATA